MELWKKKDFIKKFTKSEILPSGGRNYTGRLKCNLRCITSIILAAIFILSMVPYAGAALLEEGGTSPQVASDSARAGDGANEVTWPTGNWSTHRDITWYSMISSTYTISDAEDLAGLAGLVNAGNSFSGKTIRLGADIDLSAHLWTPIGTSPNPFKGTFIGAKDGKNYKISGLYINSSSSDYQGLFGFVEDAKIENVHIESGVVNGKTNVGGVAGYVSNMNSSISTSITDCSNAATVTGGEISASGKVSGGRDVGGVAGQVCVGAEITGCSNTGKVSGGNGVGGVVGYANNVISCSNTGEVSGETNVGGVVGYAGSSATSCTNSGAVSGETNVGGVVGSAGNRVTSCTNSNKVSGKNSVGGVAGSASGQVTGCTNESEVTGTGDYIGGIAGFVSWSLLKCTNLGAVSGNRYVGGVTGYAVPNTGSVIFISSCSNTGTVTGSGTYGDYVGGVVGHTGESSLDNCINTGEVSGDRYVGGMAGFVPRSNVVSCYYTGYDIGIGSIREEASTAKPFAKLTLAEESIVIEGTTNVNLTDNTAAATNALQGADKLGPDFKVELTTGYSSSDTTVASVSNDGEVTGNKIGTSNITRQIKITQNVYGTDKWSDETRTITASTMPAMVAVGLLIPEAEDFSFTEPEDLVYDGNSKSATVETDETGMGSITVKYKKVDSGEWTTTAPKEAGDYTVCVDVERGDRYTRATEIRGDDWKFTIEKATPTLTLEDKEETYTGSVIEMEDASGVPDEQEATYIYYIDTDCTIPTTEENSGAEGNGKAPKNAGTYYVKVAVEESENYEGAEAKAKLVIKKKDITAASEVTLDPSTYTYDGKKWQPKVKVTLTQENDIERLQDGASEMITLEEGKDYKIIYPKDMTSVGKKTITVQFKGNYSGEKTVKGEILAPTPKPDPKPTPTPGPKPTPTPGPKPTPTPGPKPTPTPGPKPTPTPGPKPAPKKESDKTPAEKEESGAINTNDPMNYAILIGMSLVAVVSGGAVSAMRKRRLDN